ncbi:hypothetical protein JD292_03145 [Leucobacter sp. CSA2]|uniref:Uncharacterized protein n=1 Tax=Leucobacter edaphi TaxID=2796472 RepID=A0A934QD58_9MICO|nr:hypothetical protein [Leucobacter edaphi]MBK0421077.1 hypothetical protein [Leucobacter edaphi]
MAENITAEYVAESAQIEDIPSVEAEQTTSREIVTGSVLGVAALSSVVLVGFALATVALYTVTVFAAIFSTGS